MEADMSSFLGWGDPLEEGVAIHSSILAWRILWREKPGGLQSIASQRARHEYRNGTGTHARTHVKAVYCHSAYLTYMRVQYSSVTQSCPTLCDLMDCSTRLSCPSPTPGACSNSCPLSRWCHPTISSSVIPFFFCLQSFPAAGSFPMSQLFVSGGQSIGVSASTSVLLMNIQDWFPLGWTGWTSSQSKGLSRVFSNTTVQKHQSFSAQLSL